MEEQEKYISALVELHRGLERQGPGDTGFSNYIIAQIPELPTNPRIADIGCGTGAGTLFLADKFKSKVRAVDFSRDFLDELEDRAKQRGLEHLVESIEYDMGNLNWESGTIDLLWSEGAAYNLTFEGALKTWRPLMAANGIAVISEISYFTFDPCKECDMPCHRSCPRGAFRSGAFKRNFCREEVDQREANAEILDGSIMGIEEASQVTKYCRKCEFACPVAQGETYTDKLLKAGTANHRNQGQIVQSS
jgi:SAM-dependent methyltransferase